MRGDWSITSLIITALPSLREDQKITQVFLIDSNDFQWNLSSCPTSKPSNPFFSLANSMLVYLVLILQIAKFKIIIFDFSAIISICSLYMQLPYDLFNSSIESWSLPLCFEYIRIFITILLVFSHYRVSAAFHIALHIHFLMYRSERYSILFVKIFSHRLIFLLFFGTGQYGRKRCRSEQGVSHSFIYNSTHNMGHFLLSITLSDAIPKENEV